MLSCKDVSRKHKAKFIGNGEKIPETEVVSNEKLLLTASLFLIFSKVILKVFFFHLSLRN